MGSWGRRGKKVPILLLLPPPPFAPTAHPPFEGRKKKKVARLAKVVVVPFPRLSLSLLSPTQVKRETFSPSLRRRDERGPKRGYLKGKGWGKIILREKEGPPTDALKKICTFLCPKPKAKGEKGGRGTSVCHKQ